MSVHDFPGATMRPMESDYEKVGEYLDEIKVRWENGEIGSIAFVYESRDRKTIHTGWSLLPGTGISAVIGWCHLVIKDLMKAMSE